MSSASTSSRGGNGSTSSGPSLFPMVEKTFRPRITEDMERDLRFRGQSRVDALTADVLMTPVKSKGNIRLYELEEKEFFTMKGVTTVNASLGDVMNVLKMETTHKMRDVMRVLLGGLFLDGVVLYTGKDTPGRPYESLSVNWMAVQAAKPHLPARDYVYLRYGDVFEKTAEDNAYNAQGSGLFVGASIWESIEVDGCAPLPPSQNVTRLRMRRCGIVVEELNHNDQLQVALIISEPVLGNGKGGVTSLTKQWMVKMVSSVAHFADAVTSETLSEQRILTKQQFVMDGVSCYICTKAFTLLRRKHHCRVCGDVVCSKCSDMKVVRQEGKVTEVRVCVTCKKGGNTGTSSSMQDTRLSPSLASGHGMSAFGLKSNASSISDDDMSRSIPRMQTVIREHVHTPQDPSMPLLDSSQESGDMILLKGKPNDIGSRSAAPTANGMILLNGSSSSTMSTQESTISSFGHVHSAPALTPEEMANAELAITVRENTPFAYALSYSSRQDWPKAPLPLNEAARVAKVRSLHLVDVNQQYQEMCEYAAAEMGCNMGAICFIGDKNGFLMAKIGLENREVPRNILFEAHTIMSDKPTVVLDATEDIRFANNPLVKEGQIRFYAGFPLVTQDGFVVGSLTIADPFARECLTGDKYFFLKKLADMIIHGIEETTARIMDMDPSSEFMTTPSMSSMSSVTSATRAEMDISTAQMTMQELLRTAYTTQCQVRMNVEALNK